MADDLVFGKELNYKVTNELQVQLNF